MVSAVETDRSVHRTFCVLQRFVIGEFEGNAGDRFGNEFQHEWIVVGEVVAPASRPVDTAAIAAGNSAFVVAEITTPNVDFPFVLATILLRQNSAVGHA